MYRRRRRRRGQFLANVPPSLFFNLFLLYFLEWSQKIRLCYEAGKHLQN